MIDALNQQQMTSHIHIDGSEGGGQLLRSALSLSLVTGQPFRMTNIRGARKPKPGLMRQHLTCVNAAAEVGDAAVDGAELGSMELVFSPGKIQGGDYRFAIGTGGSTLLVLQTLLPALWHANAPSTLRIEGGTHNPMAPPFEFVDQCFLPALAPIGAAASLKLERHGFMQAGGGVVTASVAPVPVWRKLSLLERGPLIETFGQVINAAVPATVAERQIATAAPLLGWSPEAFAIQELTENESAGPGNAILVGARFAHVCEIATGIAQRGTSAESVGHAPAKSLRTYLASHAPVGTHLADQLLLPMALGKGGEFRTLPLSRHSRTNMALIEKFLPVKWQAHDLGGGVWQVACTV